MKWDFKPEMYTMMPGLDRRLARWAPIREHGFITIITDREDLKAHQQLIANGWGDKVALRDPEHTARTFKDFDLYHRAGDWSFWNKGGDLTEYWKEFHKLRPMRTLDDIIEGNRS